MTDPVTEGVELIDYLRIIWKRRRVIIFGTLLSVITGGVVSLFLPPRYEASAQIRIGRVWDKEVDNPYLVSEFINSDAFLARVVDRLNLSLSPYELKKERTIDISVLEGGAGQKLPLLLLIRTHYDDPQKAVDIANVVSSLLIEEHQLKFEEKLREYETYEKELSQETARIEQQIVDLEGLIKKQAINPQVNAPSVILLQAQLEQKSAQLLNFKKELMTTKINNNSSIATENSKLIAPPVLPKNHVNPKTLLNMAVAGGGGFFISLVSAFFLEYLERARIRKT